MIKIYGITVEHASKYFEEGKVAYAHKNLPDHVFHENVDNIWAIDDFINLLNYDMIDTGKYFFRAFDGNKSIKVL